MKNISTLSFLLFLCLPMFGQNDLAITHLSYGDGLIIEIGDNWEFDMNDDGITDFSLNSTADAIDFTPRVLVGCFASNGEIGNLGSQVVSQFEKDDFISITNYNLFDYIDDEEGFAFTPTDGLADDWIDMKDTYVGFAVFLGGSYDLVSNGWMKVAIDVTNQTLILKELAYTEASEITEGGGIHAGDNGLASSLNDLSNQLNNVSIFPNPASDQVQISFEYSSTQNLQLEIANGMGIIVYSSEISNPANANLTLGTHDWTPGTYFVQLRNDEGVNTSRLVID